MAADRSTQRVKAAVERRPPAAEPRSTAPAHAPARSLQERYGNSATQSLIARAVARGAVQLSAARRLPTNVSKLNDPAELEAEETARKVMRMREPVDEKPVAPKTPGKSTVQRVEASSAPPASAPAAVSGFSVAGGAPLPPTVRRQMEPRFGANFGHVRVHTGTAAAQQSAALNAHAFTVGPHIFFGKDKFQPQSAGGQELIAHELTHTIQQGASLQRSEDTTVAQRSPPRIQRLGISDALDYFADKANLIPGFRMFTIVLGVNPINMSRVERSAANLLRALIEIMPGGVLITQALDSYGIFDKVGAWVEQQIQTLGLVGTTIKQAITAFLDSLSWTDIFDLGGVWERAKRIFTEPIDRISSFAEGLVAGIVRFVKDAILMPLAKLAEGTRGWNLLIAVLGQNPITGEPVPRTAETLIGGFMKLIGQEEVWENIKKANAIARAWAWFQGALAGLLGFVRQIPTLFMSALQGLELIDIVVLPKAFAKLAGVFGGFVAEFLSWAGNAVWHLLEIIFEAVAPVVMPYLRKTGAALKSILRNPLPFVGNLVKAAKLSFLNFADSFLEHLKTGLIDWLTGSLPGVYIPKAFSLTEIAKFAFSILRLTWAYIRQKLVKVVGETAVKAMETGFDIVVTLVRDGPAAAWDKIKEQLSNLKDMVIGGITDFVVDLVVKKAIPKLIAMFIPGAGFISAILSIYDTIMVFVNKLAQISQVVMGFIDSIVAIANGAVAAAAGRVEKILAGLLSLAISFLAGFAGVGKVADKVMAVINKVRAPIDKALDWLVGWIVAAAKRLGKMVAQAGVPQDPTERVRLAADAAVAGAKRLGRGITRPLLQPLLAGIQLRYGLKQIEAFERGGTWWVRAVANPEAIRNLEVIVVKEGEALGAAAASKLEPMPLVSITFECNTLKYVQSVYDQQLAGQEAGLNAMSVIDWEKNRLEYDKSGRGSSVPQEEVRELYRKDLAARGKIDDEIEAELERLAALHEPDLVAGGFNVIAKLGSRYINSSIGSQWRTKVLLIKAAVDKLPKSKKPTMRVNVKLTSVAIKP